MRIGRGCRWVASLHAMMLEYPFDILCLGEMENSFCTGPVNLESQKGFKFTEVRNLKFRMEFGTYLIDLKGCWGR